MWQNVDVHKANLVVFLYSFLDNFYYFHGIWFLFDVNNHHDTCIKRLLQNAIWFIWKDNLGRLQHHLLPLNMKKKTNYCRIHHLWIRQFVLNVHNVNLVMTSPHWCPPSSLCLVLLKNSRSELCATSGRRGTNQRAGSFARVQGHGG